MIRKCSKKEFLRFLRHKSVLARLGKFPDKIRGKNLFVVERLGSRLYFFFVEVHKHTVEMHVGAIKEHRPMARQMILEALDFVKAKGYKFVITWVPEIFKSTLNMAEKLGFLQIDKVYSDDYLCNAIYLGREI